MYNYNPNKETIITRTAVFKSIMEGTGKWGEEEKKIANDAVSWIIGSHCKTCSCELVVEEGSIKKIDKQF